MRKLLPVLLLSLSAAASAGEYTYTNEDLNKINSFSWIGGDDMRKSMACVESMNKQYPDLKKKVESAHFAVDGENLLVVAVGHKNDIALECIANLNAEKATWTVTINELK